MSRSRRAAREQAKPAPITKNIWTAGDGGIRTGWLLAVSLFGYALATLATRYGLIRGFDALFSAWGFISVFAASAFFSVFSGVFSVF